ncbi:methylenetetrahydrofolate reductase [Agaribacterium haliotis]|uniref:methylenetetrahydrofolate reductase n=1 Tax=Agaribacterium haliotis TaxID=2013869 RepID=UPI000BB55F4A|nr:methylenetetrahydrofolate reductase [Agaribacterium haliotis]
MLRDKIQNKKHGIVLYGIVPPKEGTDAQKIQAIAERQIHRLSNKAIDGLVLYDIQDEAERTDVERPFPYIKTLDNFAYAREQLAAINTAKIIYRAVGKYSKDQLSDFINALDSNSEMSVFVGAASKDQKVSLSVDQAYALRNSLRPDLLLGGVTIPERHSKKHDEHLRVAHKQQSGCSFFISQGVYDLNASKNFLSDYYYFCQEQALEPVPIIFTLTPCGSTKTLEFMKWLGISVPRWLENELRHADDILASSVDFCMENWLELLDFARKKQLPIGCNIESVAVRKAEIDASIQLLDAVIQSLNAN